MCLAPGINVKCTFAPSYILSERALLATVRPMSRAKLAQTEAAQRVHKRLTKYGRILRLI